MKLLVNGPRNAEAEQWSQLTPSSGLLAARLMMKREAGEAMHFSDGPPVHASETASVLNRRCYPQLVFEQ